ncbi:hypothetical protein C5167_020059 [Papaver somniferum]|uniref:Transposase MuDR plant domain-containing protein n=1 Tax=Papaver somniferum TaxID=3469 RepID=A0A4Y7IV21_PAPSO|nr:hypothetical protein C5167_020059 [Papaver somniferum]
MDPVSCAAVSCIVVVRYSSDFITLRVNTDIKLEEFKEQVCRELKQFTPLDSSISNGSSSTSSSRNNLTVAMYLEDKRKPAKPLLSDGWTKVLGEIGHVFVEGVTQVRVAFTKYLLRTGFQMIVTHNERSRFTAKCADEKCGWKFHAASIDERNEMFQVRSYNPEHICGAGGRNLNQTYSTSFSSSLIDE